MTPVTTLLDAPPAIGNAPIADLIRHERDTVERKLAAATRADHTRSRDFYRGQLHALRTIEETLGLTVRTRV